ncbi:unnamed protein product (macronuclear) [Paramecium tetraurelia]|uniref:Uncharacterized protein n=1 Tax=Paramecium tetraurelia TaxID=5888 RepID=A0C8Y7_PARTE|nr:uncharacterized protein GSPATT00036390001 [Paramecium tetraurelia]CAK67254.1 unnamed protein product [Paramecium tetraurelia]|eukprot:XP_001434651.1 hypothetical protein (macronuclear) [Paramecium tetraurelia strain d4-2]
MLFSSLKSMLWGIQKGHYQFVLKLDQLISIQKDEGIAQTMPKHQSFVFILDILVSTIYSQDSLLSPSNPYLFWSFQFQSSYASLCQPLKRKIKSYLR